MRFAFLISGASTKMHIAQLKRIYYLDVPAAYSKLNDVFPPLSVKPFGHFFAEADTLPT